MLARTKCVDFHYVEEHQLAIHDRLLNWSRYVGVRHPGWVSPIWKLGRSNGRQWHVPEIRVSVNTQDGHIMEKAVAALPWAHRDAVRWAYIHRTNPSKPRRALGVTDDGLFELIRAGRQMLINRRV